MATNSCTTDQGAIDVSYPASGDISAHQYKAVVLDSSEEVALAGANAKVFGILQNAPDAQGEMARVRIHGVSLVKVSETIATGKYLTSTSAGLGEVVDAADEHCFGYALGDGVANDLIDVLVTPFNATDTDA